MHLLLGQLIREELIWRVKDAKWFSILVDEVTDCATIEQLLIYVGYVDEEGKPHFDFLEMSIRVFITKDMRPYSFVENEGFKLWLIWQPNKESRCPRWTGFLEE